MNSIAAFLILISFNSFALTNIELGRSILDPSPMIFIPHTGSPNSFSNALALNIEYDQIKKLRKIIENEIGTNLKFLTAWNIDGEAHVTTISPPEYKDVLRHFISMRRINEIALEHSIQSADIRVLGIGSGKLAMKKKDEETFFLIVDSNKLRNIRHKIYKEFVQNGGDPSAFDPTWFFPHITVGYTKKDIHESNGLFKNTKHSFDNRFSIKLTN
jgi:hypothetical protein